MDENPAPTADLDKWGVTTAIAGLRIARERYEHAHREQVPFHEEAAVAAIDFTTWACALDELLRTTDSTYAARRDTDEDGRVLIPLRFVRDRHMHQVAMVPGMVFNFSFDANRQPLGLSSINLYWRDLNQIRRPDDWHSTKANYEQGRSAYQDQLEGRSPLVALEAAHRFLTSELEARGIEVSVSSE